ncbi:diguanylate cyclase/phosphodiesterase (GGDEF & EAL domains) with PAS/PAC sensor(s) [hydrothermal vent metagenome]|uniref:Diguanylate cyclase/phosphodiesterase (GGDEF & EAL domains) with PAS/PAC sensor(S) n=1 Tax=hydrothermal vent metagenome TaxID=652676 RepID=A0A3B0ZQM5_9ZZZZ
MQKPLRVLIVDDSEDDAALLVRQIRKGDYEPVVTRVETLEALHQAMGGAVWDIIISDHNMPEFDSIAVLGVIREYAGDVPVLIVSGSIGEDKAVSAMKAGASDYVMKDNLARLVPVIGRELREAGSRRKRRKAEEALHYMAYHDALTDLVNRSEFERRLGHALLSAREARQTHALLYLDLDQFKVINDTCGHAAGDELLRQIALILSSRLRDRDTLARLGGDEFAVLLESCPLDHAEEIGDVLRLAIRDFRFSWKGKQFSVGVSVGLVAIDADSGSLADVMSYADAACYSAKDNGRNQLQVYKQHIGEASRLHGEMHWVTRIREALENDLFVLYQQPIVSLTDAGGTGMRCEFLLRMQDRDGGLIPPGAFIPAAERYNLITEIDRWVVGHVCQIMSNSAGPAHLCFVNLSGQTLGDKTFPTFIRQQFSRFNIDPTRICFEITETAAITNLKNAVQFMLDLKTEGCFFALDDFGAGLSSFAYLKTLPADYLKIDGGFVRAMIESPMDNAIVQAIHQIGKIAGMRTIAEFVEDDALRSRLQAVGIGFAQGFAIEPPRPLAARLCRAI